jgi:hypothetical protein
MKIFQCGHCAQSLFFESYTCENCGHLSGFRDEDRKMLTFEPNDDSLISDREQIEYRCKIKYNVCNWLVKRIPRRILSNLSTKSNDTEPF